MIRQWNVKIIASAVAILGSAGYLLADTLSSDPDALTYFHNADAVIMQKQSFAGQRIRMGGKVQPGTIAQKPGTLEYYFEVRPLEEMTTFVEAKGKSMPVHYTGIVPDTFKDDAHVIVTGSVQPDGSFLGKELTAKCPSKYEAEEKNNGTYGSTK